MRLLPALAAASLLTLAACDRGVRPEQLGQPAPQFAVHDAQSSVDLSKLRGQVVLLNFWASWCAPCLEELPTLEQLHHQMPALQVVGVSIDTDSGAYREFLVAHHVDFLTVIDPEGRSNALYGTFRPPETFVIDKHGAIRRKFIGPQTWTSPEIVHFLQKLQAEA